MKKVLATAGWTLRASALICIVWIFAQALGGKITMLAAILDSVLWHAGFALSGVALVGASRTGKAREDGDAAAVA